MNDKQNDPEVNLFHPKKGYMRDEVRIIFLILIGWGVATFGFQLLLWLLSGPDSHASFLTRLTFFNLPLHFWFTGQFLPLWFVLLCVIFNLYIDTLMNRYSRRRDENYD